MDEAHDGVENRNGTEAEQENLSLNNNNNKTYDSLPDVTLPDLQLA